MNIGNRIGYSVYAESNVTFQTLNPRTNQCNDNYFHQASENEVELAIQLGVNAFNVYSKLSGKSKSSFFSEIIRLIHLNERELIIIYCLESGLDENRAHIELKRTINQINNFSILVENDEWRKCSFNLSDETRVPPMPEIRKGLFPLGPVVVFGASNFPFAYSTIGGDAISALAAGCSVIIKSHTLHAGTGDLMSKIVIEAAKNTGMPEGVFSNLNALDYTVGERLILDSRIQAVGFTGSVKGGKAIIELTNKRKNPIPVFAEMGSSNPVIVFPTSERVELELWAEKLATSITNNAGQFCTKPGLIFVLETTESRFFIERLEEKVLSKDFQLMLHTSIFNNFEKLIIERESSILINQKAGEKKVNFASPTVGICDSGDFLNDQKLSEEVFGPFSLIVKCNSLEEIKKCIDILEGQLTGSIFCNDIERSIDDELLLILQSKVGRLIFNGVPTGVETVPSMQHGGPFPSSSDSRFTAVGIDSIKRFVRPIAFQNYPTNLLPDFLK